MSVFQRSGWRSYPQQQLNPDQYRAMIEAHPNRQRVRWFRARMAAEYDQTTGTGANNQFHATVREEVANAQAYWAIIDETMPTRRAYSDSEMRVGAISIITMADELPLSDGDMIIPMGRTITNGIPDVQWRMDKQTNTRADSPETMPGSISATGREITGVGTAFLTDIRVGEILSVLDEYVEVAYVRDNTHLTLTANAPVNFSGLPLIRCADKPPYWPVIAVDGIWTVNGPVPSSAYRIGAYGDRIEWLDNLLAPQPGENYAINYRYLPRYVVRESMGVQRGIPVNGQAMPQQVYASVAGGPVGS